MAEEQFCQTKSFSRSSSLPVTYRQWDAAGLIQASHVPCKQHRLFMFQQTLANVTLSTLYRSLLKTIYHALPLSLLFCACHFVPIKDTWHGVAGSPKGIAKLLTVSESGRLRSPPLVEKFRRTKENMLQSLQNQPTNNKLMSLERMFHEVTPCCNCPKLYLMQPLLCRTQIHT